ncbi:MAG TPA: alginate export family protein, partial [Hyphomonadaceae bacterium]
APGGGMSLRGFGEARLRFESVSSDLPAAEEDLLTLRVQAGAETQLSERTTLVGELEWVADLYRDETQDGPPGPVIPDRETLEINRLQLTHDFGAGQVVAGRQRLAFDDERFVGTSAFRQNEQTYDAARVSLPRLGPIAVDMAYVWQVNRFLSTSDVESRFNGDTWLLNISADTPAGRLSGYHYALDLDDGTGAPLDEVNSSVTSGIGIAGRHYWNNLGVGWRADYAHQRDYAGNPLEYSADYWRAVGMLDFNWASLSAGHEVLGEGGPRAFQTPLGTNHARQGAADMFVVTPVSGVRDTFVEGVWPLDAIGPLRGLTATLRHHWFAGDIAGEDLGSEWDASLRAAIAGVQASIEYAAYSADSFGDDTQKLWLSLRRSF